jgi:hypothetical protein
MRLWYDTFDISHLMGHIACVGSHGFCNVAYVILFTVRYGDRVVGIGTTEVVCSCGSNALVVGGFRRLCVSGSVDVPHATLHNTRRRIK